MAIHQFVKVRHLGFQYSSSPAPLFDDLNVHFEPGFTGVVGANGSGKSTLLQLLSGDLALDSGQITGVDDLIHCDQRTDTPPEMLEAFLEDDDGQAYALRGRLGIECDFLERWPTLSHGERKRAQIGTALWQAPSVLTIDEPTNHIDGDARALLLESLKRFRGVGIIVSHDRELLDELCSHTLWLDGQPKLIPGGYSKAKEQRALDRQTIIHERESLRKSQQTLNAEVSRRKDKAAQADKKNSKSGIDKKDHDAKGRINRARLTGKDGEAGRLLSQLSGRKQQMEDRMTELQVTKEREVSFWLESTKSKRNLLIETEPLSIPIGEYRSLTTPELRMKADEHVAITGANGMGKSTLLNALMPGVNVPEERLLYMPQEITAEQSRVILHDIKALPKRELGKLMIIVSSLGSDPKSLLRTELPSPGEVRKLMLAFGISRDPWLIVMDEPTNHLDLPSIEALENALASCPCGLLLVSHDQNFLGNLATTYWHLAEVAEGSRLEIREADPGQDRLRPL